MPNERAADFTATTSAPAVLRAARKLTAGLEAELQREQLGIDHWLAVEALAAAAGLTMAELQAQTATAGPTLTRVVDKLISLSLAYREVDAVDRRKVRVYLSPRGDDLRARLSPALAEVEDRWLAAEGSALRKSLTRRGSRSIG